MQSFTPIKEYWSKDNIIKKILGGKQYDKTNITIKSEAQDKIKVLQQLSPDKRLSIDCIDTRDGNPRDFVACRTIGLEDSDDLPKSITIARFFNLEDDRDVTISLIFEYESMKLTCDMTIKMKDKKYDPSCTLDINIY